MRRTLLLLAAVVLCSCERRTPAPTPTPSPSPTPKPTATAAPTPAPIPSLPRKPVDLARMFNGLTYKTDFATPQGDQPASVDREQDASYQVRIEVNATLPRPSSTIEDLAANDPKLPVVLNQMNALMAGAKVSPYFEKLYRLKIENIRRELFDLNSVLSRHNFYDCETILELQSPATGRKALLIVGDMDVNVDGSDGDRNFTVDGSGRFFQPQTSYRWPRQTDRPNPFADLIASRIDEAKKAYAVKGLSSARNRELQDLIGDLTRTQNDLQRYSFLISAADPFIVVPSFILNDTASPFAPKVGDYAVVIYQGVVYPAIVGDAGPSFKVGEASLRLCRQIDPRSSGLSRPVNNVNASYLIFPGTAEPASVPDLVKWQAACHQYLDEIGGIAPELFTWQNVVPPWPTPTPTPTPTPIPSPTSGPAPEATIPPLPTGSPSPSADEPNSSATPTATPQVETAPTPPASPAPSPAVTP